MKKIGLAGADLAYSGCAEKKIEDNFVVRYDYEGCVIAFYKKDLVVVVEVRMLESERKSATKETGDQLLAEALKIVNAFILMIK